MLSISITLIQAFLHIKAIELNLIVRTGMVPSQFKTSVVTPIYKSGDKTDISNFRPISSINNFSKILEKCLKDLLTSF